MSEPFIAEIRIFAGNFAPRGWSFCDGQLLPISQHTALFSIIGTTYGGDGRTTTALPNMKGRAPMHPGRGPGLTSRRLGENVGAETAPLSEAQMASHNHALTAVPSATQANPDSSVRLGNAAMYQTPGTTVDMASEAAGNTGGSQSHNNMQPFLTLNFIIALIGLFPSRS